MHAAHAPSRSRRPLLLALAMLVLAGVMLAVPAMGQDLGPGCDPDRQAVAHGPGGAPVQGATRVLVPCGTETGYYTGETTIAVSDRGTVWFSAADWEWALVRSHDNGATWERFAVPGPQAYPGCPGIITGLLPKCDTSQQGKNNTVADAFLYIEPTSQQMMWSKTYGYATCSSMNFTRDDGATWTAVTQFACPGGDYEKIAGGPAPEGGAQPTGGFPSVLYTCTNGPAPTFVVGPTRICYKSLDGGLNWTVTGASPVPSPQAPGCLHFQEAPSVAPDGTLYQPLGCALGSASGAVVRVAISKDEGTTWTYSALPMTTESGAPTGLGGVSLAVDRAGNVYVVWGGNSKPQLSVSTDGGTTWSHPVDAGAPGVNVIGSVPQVAAQEDGHIAIAYYGLPEGGPANTRNGYLTESFDATADSPTFYSAQLNETDDPLYRPTDGGSLPRNDYLGIAFGPDGTPWTALVKLRGPQDENGLILPDGEGFVQSTGFAGRLVDLTGRP